jgi:hypothetical protein
MKETEKIPKTESVQEDTPSSEEKDEQKFPTTRLGRISRPPEKLISPQAHHTCEEYSIGNDKVIAMVMRHANDIIINKADINANKFVLSYSLMKGLKEFSGKGRQAA